MRALATAVVVICAAAGTAHAERDWNAIGRKVQGGAWLHYELTALDAVKEHVDGAPTDVPDGLILAGVRLHGFIAENATVAYHAGIDLAAGGTIRGGGFAYDVALLPIGIGVRVGRTGVIAFGTGVGAIGATGTIDDAVTLPIECVAELGDGRVRWLARGRAAWLRGAPARENGAPSVPFADELDAMVGVRVGHHYEDYGFPTGNGYFVGASYRELAGARYVGLTIGYSIDLAQPRRRTPHFDDPGARDRDERLERIRRARDDEEFDEGNRDDD